MSLHLQVTMPTGLELRDWADQIVYDLDPYGSFQHLRSEKDWQNWAAIILNTSTLPSNLPVPYQFDDWREWAERFCQSMR